MTGLCRKAVLLSTLALASAATMLATLDPAVASDRLRRECRAEGAGDISMAARYEEEGRRKKFTVEFEAAPNGSFTEGQRIVFVVAGQNVGVDRLETLVGGDLIGEINYDTQAGPNDPDEDPFPAGFPQVNRGTRAQIKTGGDVILACALR